MANPNLIQELSNLIKQNWVTPSDLETVSHSQKYGSFQQIFFRMKPDGYFDKFRIGMSTGKAHIDNAGLNAVIKTAKYRPYTALTPQLNEGIIVRVDFFDEGPRATAMDLAHVKFE